MEASQKAIALVEFTQMMPEAWLEQCDSTGRRGVALRHVDKQNWLALVLG